VLILRSPQVILHVDMPLPFVDFLSQADSALSFLLPPVGALRWFSQRVGLPESPCRLHRRTQIQILRSVGRLDMLRLLEQS
jgi:hypothetical protein